MARIRSIKPEIRSSEKVCSWPIEVRYFWILLWGYVDDYGKGRDNSKLIKADSYPLDDEITSKTVEKWMKVLEDDDVIKRYTVDDKPYFLILNWSEHQKPSHPAKSVIPWPNPEPDKAQEVSGNPPEDYAKVSENGSPEQGAVEQGAVEQGSRETRKRATPISIPDNFNLDESKAQWAKENTPAVNAQLQTANFIDYWRNGDGSNKKKSNWETTWRNWMRKKQEDAEARGWKPPHPTRPVDPRRPQGW